MWVNLEVPHQEQGHPPRRVRGKVVDPEAADGAATVSGGRSWRSRGACVGDCFSSRRDGLRFPEEIVFDDPDRRWIAPSIGCRRRAKRRCDCGSGTGVATPDNFECSLPLVATTDASCNWRGRWRRLLAEAKQQLHSEGIEAATLLGDAETPADRGRVRRGNPRDPAKRFSERTECYRNVQERPRHRATEGEGSCCGSAENELPRWWRHHWNSVRMKLMEHLAREGALQAGSARKAMASAQETTADDVARRRKKRQRAADPSGSGIETAARLEAGEAAG